MAQYAIFMYGPVSAEESRVCGPEHDQHSEEVTTSGAMVAAFDLTSALGATSLREDQVNEGPFTGATDVIVGFCVIDAPDLDGALEIARSNPILGQGGGIEVRPVNQGAVVVGPVQYKS